MKRLLTKSDYATGRLTELLYNRRLSAAERRLAEQYQRILEETINELVRLYEEYQLNSENGVVLISDLYKYNKYYDLVNSLTNTIKKLGKLENRIISEELKELYRNNTELIGNQLAFSAVVNEDAMKTAINTIWCEDGKHWSSRVWNDKASLQAKLMNGLTSIITTGRGKDALVDEITTTFNTSYSNADRVVRTELAFIQNQSAIDSFREAGIKYYKVLPAHDAKVCKVCKSLENKKFSITDMKHMPPIGTHPNCRCAVIAVVD